MKKKFNKKTLFIVLGVLLLGVLTVLGTYAYYAWSSNEENKDATIAVSSVNGLGQCNKTSDNEKLLWPVSSRDKGRIVNVNAKQTLSEYANITWTLTIDSINTQETETTGLKHQSFKYELVNTTTGESYGSGNFEGKEVGDTITFSNDNDSLSYNTNYTFTLYLWIDGTMGRNPNDITNQTYQFSLVCDIVGTSYGDTPYTDFNYILGTDNDSVTALNSAYSTAMGENPTTLAQDEILLTSYIGKDSLVNVPSKYTINGVEYKVVLSPYINNNYGTFTNNNTITSIYLKNGIKVFSNNMNGTFSGCTSLTNIDLNNIDLSNITSYSDTFNSVPNNATIKVPNCTQYKLFETMFGNSYTGLTITNIDNPNFTCYYKQVEYIESTGTQRINTGYVPKINTSLELELSFNGTFKTNTSGVENILNSKTTDNKDVFSINFGSAASQYNTLFLWFNKSNDAIRKIEITDDIRTNRNTLTVTRGYASYGTVSSVIASKTADQEEELYLFGNSSKPFDRYNMRVYEMTLSESNEIEKHFIPCYSLETVTNSVNVECPRGTIGLYDTVSDVFYTNVNTDANAEPFVAGPDVNS